MRTVTLLPDLAFEPFHSMHHYAAKLRELLPGVARGFRVEAPDPPFGRPVGEHEPSVLSRYTARYLRYPVYARGRHADIIHILDHLYAHLAHVLPEGTCVITCHDLAKMAMPQFRGRHDLGYRLFQLGLTGLPRAACIIADSQFTKREIVRLRGIPAERITVVPLGVDEAFAQPIASSFVATISAMFQLPKDPFILHVGNCVPRKNVEALLHAITILRRKDQRLTLVQYGGNFSAEQRTLVGRLGLSDAVRQLPGVPINQRAILRAIYARAAVFAFPSYYEGFGLPPLEAMACGTPTVVSNRASLPEVAGDAALQVDADDYEGLAEAIARALEPDVAQLLSARGRERARRFTWWRCAHGTAAVYARVLAQR